MSTPNFPPLVARATSSPSDLEHAVLAEQLGTTGYGNAITAISKNSSVPVVSIRGHGALLDCVNSSGVSVATIAQDGTITVGGQQLGQSVDSSIYPLSEYGFASVSENIGSFRTNSDLSSWRVRMYVPANKPLVAAGVFCNTAGTLGAGGLNGFAVYSDDGQTQLASTPTDDTLYATGGWRFKDFSAPIAAQNDPYFVHLLIAINGYLAAPSTLYSICGGSGGNTYSVYSGGYNKPNHRRSVFATISSFPASFNPTSHGTITEYMLLAALATA